MSFSGSVGGASFSARHGRELDEEARLADIVGAHTGQVAPRDDANAYDLTTTFGGFPCVFPQAEFKGIAFYRAELRQLHAAVVHGSRTQAIGFRGVKE